MATPIYSYPSGGNFSGALTGAMTALGGGLQEIDAAESAKKRFQVMSDELGARGLTSDAAIYQSIADDTTPNFLTAAITGKPTDHNIDNLTDHALKILGADRELMVKAATSRDSTLVPSLSLIKGNITSNENAISILERQNAELDQKLADPSSLNSGPQEEGYKALRAKNASEIARLRAENDQLRATGAGMIQGAKRGTVVRGSDGSYRAAEQNPGAPVLPVDSGDITGKNNSGIDSNTLIPDSNAATTPPPTTAPDQAPPFTDQNQAPPSTSPLYTPSSNAGGLMSSLYPKGFAAPARPPLAAAGQVAAEQGAPPPPPATSSVTETKEPRTAAEFLKRDIADYIARGGKENPTDRKALNAAWGRLKPPIVGDAVFDNKKDADAYVAQNPGMNASIRPTPSGQLAVTLSTPSASKSNRETKTYYMNKGTNQLYVETVLPDGKSVGFKTPSGEMVTPAKMQDIIKTWNHTHGKDEAIVPVTNEAPPFNVSGQAPTTDTSANPAGGQSTGTGADYSPQAWKANQQK